MEMDSKMFWRYVHQNKHKTDNYHIIQDGDNTYVEPEEQANMWKMHFHNLLNEAPEEHKLYDNEWKAHIDNNVTNIKANCRPDAVPDGIDLTPFTRAQLQDTLASLPKGKAPGIDLLTYEHLKYGGSKLTQCLCYLFNAIVRIMEVPSGFKQGLLIPLYKGGRKPHNNKNSYRGITLLPVVNELIEKCLYDRMKNKLNEMNFPPTLQYAGKKGANSLMTSFSVQEIICISLEKHSKVFAGFLDIEKCFDKVWWNGLFHKLYKLGITDKLWLLIRNWYEYSTCVVLVNGVYSDEFNISRSIRQGGILSMLMMTVAFYDIHSHIDPDYEHGLAHGDIYLGSPAFADDIALMSYTKNGLQTMLDNAYEYSKRWRFTFSVPKSKCIVFGETKIENMRNSRDRTFIMNNQTLDEIQHKMHVGVELCAYPSSTHRTKSVCNKSHAMLANLATAGVRPNGLNPIVANMLWNKIGISSLLYGSEVWHGTTKTEMVNLEKTQVRKMKHLQGLPLRTHDYLVRALIKQPSMECMIDKRKLSFLRTLITSKGLTQSVFLHRLYSGIFSSGHTGFIQDITQVLRKYKLQNYLRTYTHGGEFPPKKHWKAIIKDSVIEYEKNMCNRILSGKGDVQRFLRIMDRRLYIKSYPLYTASMHSVHHLKLLKLAKLVCLPTGTIRQCELCNNDYHEITDRIIIS
jgi:hypothetical protein